MAGPVPPTATTAGWVPTGGGSMQVYVDGTLVATWDDATNDLVLPTNGLTITAGGLTITAGDLTVTAADVEMTAGTLALNDGGIVTQASNKSTAVTLNTHSGQITLNGAALADDTVVSFTLTNSQVEALDVVIVNHGSAGTAASYQISADTVAAGSCKINVRNISGGSLSEAIVLHFAIIHGAAS
jgi:hypothetical protein